MKLLDSCKGADGVWRLRVDARRWVTVAELEAFTVAARAEVAKRMAEPDPGPNLPCCGYPAAECECGAEVAT